MRTTGRDIEAQTEVHVTASHPPLALVVDDEASIRTFVSRVLRLAGWSVLEAPDADFDMPHITGVTLAEQLRKTDEDLPVMLVSGYPDAARSMQTLRGRTAFTRKPFGAAELIAGIGSIVG